MDEITVQWIVGFAVFAVFNCFLAVFYGIECKHRKHVKFAIAKIVLVCVSTLGFLLTDFILHDKGLPPLLSLAWFVLYWVHVVLAVINILQDARALRRAKQTAATVAQPSQEKGALSAEQTDHDGVATDDGTSSASDK